MTERVKVSDLPVTRMQRGGRHAACADCGQLIIEAQRGRATHAPCIPPLRQAAAAAAAACVHVQVVVRHLPPGLTEQGFQAAMDKVVPEGSYTWLSYWPGKARQVHRLIHHGSGKTTCIVQFVPIMTARAPRSLKRVVLSYAYLAFTKPEHVYAFKAAFDGHTFVTTKGSQYRYVCPCCGSGCKHVQRGSSLYWRSSMHATPIHARGLGRWATYLSAESKLTAQNSYPADRATHPSPSLTGVLWSMRPTRKCHNHQRNGTRLRAPLRKARDELWKEWRGGRLSQTDAALELPVQLIWVALSFIWDRCDGSYVMCLVLVATLKPIMACCCRAQTQTMWRSYRSWSRVLACCPAPQCRGKHRSDRKQRTRRPQRPRPSSRRSCSI
jgi:hypothetical protein